MIGSVAKISSPPKGNEGKRSCKGSGCQAKEIIYELDLTANIVASNQSNLPLSHYVHRFITLNGLSGRCNLSRGAASAGPRRFPPSLSLNYKAFSDDQRLWCKFKVKPESVRSVVRF
jgi:hypothetical protein